MEIFCFSILTDDNYLYDSHKQLVIILNLKCRTQTQKIPFGYQKIHCYHISKAFESIANTELLKHSIQNLRTYGSLKQMNIFYLILFGFLLGKKEKGGREKK